MTWFQAFNPFMIFAFTPFIVALWRRQGQTRALDSRPSSRSAASLTAGAYLIMVAGRARRRRQASWLWLFAYFFVLTVGELYLSPTSLSLVTKVAPASRIVDDDGRVARRPVSSADFSPAISARSGPA